MFADFAIELRKHQQWSTQLAGNLLEPKYHVAHLKPALPVVLIATHQIHVLDYRELEFANLAHQALALRRKSGGRIPDR